MEVEYRPLSEYESKLRIHAILVSVSFLIIIPLGVLIPRLLRTFSNRWWWAHWVVNFLIACPLVYAALAMAVEANHISHTPIDHHKRVGYAVFTLYGVQVLLGAFIHFVRVPFLFIGHRPPQNWIHAALGFTILALAAYQIHYGMYVQWPRRTGNIHPVPQSAKNAWLALVIIFWTLYFLGLILFGRRQWQQEEEGSLLRQDKEES